MDSNAAQLFLALLHVYHPTLLGINIAKQLYLNKNNMWIPGHVLLTSMNAEFHPVQLHCTVFLVSWVVNIILNVISYFGRWCLLPAWAYIVPWIVADTVESHALIQVNKRAYCGIVPRLNMQTRIFSKHLSLEVVSFIVKYMISFPLEGEPIHYSILCQKAS